MILLYFKPLVLFDSEDGFNWKLASKPLVSKLEINWANGEIQKVLHLERPQLLLEEGKIIALVCAADIKDNDNVIQSFNIQIPVLEN